MIMNRYFDLKKFVGHTSIELAILRESISMFVTLMNCLNCEQPS